MRKNINKWWYVSTAEVMGIFLENAQAEKKIIALIVDLKTTGAKIALWKSLLVGATIATKKDTKVRNVQKKGSHLKKTKSALTAKKLDILPVNVKRKELLKRGSTRIAGNASIAIKQGTYQETVEKIDMKRGQTRRSATTAKKSATFPETAKRKEWKDVMDVERQDT